MARPRQYVDAPVMPCPGECKRVLPIREFYPENTTRDLSTIMRYPTCRMCHAAKKQKKWNEKKELKAFLLFWTDFSDIAKHLTERRLIPKMIARLLEYSAETKNLLHHEPSLYAQILKSMNKVYPLSDEVKSQVEALIDIIEADERQSVMTPQRQDPS